MRSGHQPPSPLADDLSHVDEPVLLQQQRLETMLETGAAEAIRPTMIQHIVTTLGLTLEQRHPLSIEAPTYLHMEWMSGSL